MAKFNEYTQKATPADNDTMMIYDATAKANRLSPFSGIWNWIVEKLTNAVISNLQTSNKSVIGALNELNGKLNVDTKTISYTDSEWSSLGGIDECVKDAVNKNRIPIDGMFYKQFIARVRYLMIGYRYVNGKYGTIILYNYDQTGDARYSITNGKLSKVK